MVQKRLLSWNPAEPKIRRLTLAACAHPGASARMNVANAVTATISSPANIETNLDFIVRSSIAIGLYVSKLGIEVIAQPVAQQVQREHRQHDGDPGEHRNPPRRDDQFPS